MTPLNQRVAIAKARGWTGPFKSGEWIKEYTREGLDYYADLAGTDPDGDRAPLRNYLEDLNAMHEVEKSLTDDEFYDWSKDKHADMSYNGHLFRIVDRDTPLDKPCRYHSASAAQRAEAFLRTINKWEDDK